MSALTDDRAKTYVSTKCSKLETALVNAWECVYGTYYHMTGWKFQKQSLIYGDIPLTYPVERSNPVKSSSPASKRDL